MASTVCFGKQIFCLPFVVKPTYTATLPVISRSKAQLQFSPKEKPSIIRVFSSTIGIGNLRLGQRLLCFWCHYYALKDPNNKVSPTLMAGERRYQAESDFYRPNYRNSQLAPKEFTSPGQQPTAAPAIQSELSSEQNPPPSRVKVDLKRARTKYANAADESVTSPSSSKHKPRLELSSSVISRLPTPTTNNLNLAMDQPKVSKPSGIHDYSDDLDSLTSTSPHPETSHYSKFKPSPSRSSSYSPPPSKPKVPKGILGAVAKSKERFPPVLGKRSTEKGPSCSPSLTSSMMYAPWNDHQSGMGDPAILSTPEHGIELSDSEVDHPVKRARRNSLSPESIKLCDNYGCNAMHSHLDCPLGMKCWGCRANTHYTSACPMTCVKCGFAGHARKFCEDFEFDPRAGIPRPRRPTVKPASADKDLPSLPCEKAYQCDNYPCRGLHSHFDCPLPTICWGCRATDHFWSGCHARCDKCGAQRHTSKYCNEFESWMNGKSRPKRSPDEIRRIITMKRQRGIEMQQVEESTQRPHSLNGSTYPTPRSVASSTPLQPSVGRPVSSSPREHGRLTPNGSHPEEHASSLGAHHEQTTPSQAIPTQPRISWNNFPVLEHGPNGEKIYCTYWLRTGNCSFKNSSVGCLLKHKVPAQKQLQDGIGINFSSPWLQDDPVVREYHKKGRCTLRPSNRVSGEHGQHELHHQPSLTESHTWLREPLGNQEPVKKTTTTMSPFVREPPTQPAKHFQPAKQSIRNVDVSEPFSEPKKSSLSKSKAPITAKEPRVRTPESRHRHTPQTESGSISPYRTTTQIDNQPKSKPAETAEPLRGYNYGSRSAHPAGTENASEPAYITTPQTTNLTKAAATIAPRATAETLARMEDANRKHDAAKNENFLKEETLFPKVPSSNPKQTAPQSSASPPSAPLAAITTEDSRAAKLKAFEEEEFFRQRRHEAEMARKKEELRLVYEHEKMMAELRRG